MDRIIDNLLIILSRVNNPHFLIFSDDYDWVRKNLNFQRKIYVNGFYS